MKKMAGCVKLDRDDAGELYRILKLLLQKFGE